MCSKRDSGWIVVGVIAASFATYWIACLINYLMYTWLRANCFCYGEFYTKGVLAGLVYLGAASACNSVVATIGYVIYLVVKSRKQVDQLPIIDLQRDPYEYSELHYAK